MCEALSMGMKAMAVTEDPACWRDRVLQQLGSRGHRCKVGEDNFAGQCGAGVARTAPEPISDGSIHNDGSNKGGDSLASEVDDEECDDDDAGNDSDGKECDNCGMPEAKCECEALGRGMEFMVDRRPRGEARVGHVPVARHSKRGGHEEKGAQGPRAPCEGASTTTLFSSSDLTCLRGLCRSPGSAGMKKDAGRGHFRRGSRAGQEKQQRWAKRNRALVDECPRCHIPREFCMCTDTSDGCSGSHRESDSGASAQGEACGTQWYMAAPSGQEPTWAGTAGMSLLTKCLHVKEVGNRHANNGKWISAVSVWEWAAYYGWRCDPIPTIDLLKLHLNLANGYVKWCRPQDAVRHCDVILTGVLRKVGTKQLMGKAHYRLGMARLAMQQPEAAAACFRQAIDIDPSNKEAQQRMRECM